MNQKRVYISRSVPTEAIDLLRSHNLEVAWWPHEIEGVPTEQLIGELRQSDGALLMMTDRIDAAVIEAIGPRCKVLANLAVGYDNIDVAAATQRGILVANTPGVLTESTADLAFALMMATGRRLYEGQRTIVEGQWKGWGPLFMAGQDIHGATLGVIGAGRIGSAVARRAKGFDMKILYHNRSHSQVMEQEIGAEYRDLDSLLRDVDFLVLLVPLTPETKGMIGERELRLMKRSAVLVNAARGPVVQEEALYRALKEGWIWAAGLDVYAKEPLPADNPLLSLPNVTAVPHIGSSSVATRTRMSTLAAENIIAALEGRRPPTPVNPEVLG